MVPLDLPPLIKGSSNECKVGTKENQYYYGRCVLVKEKQHEIICAKKTVWWSEYQCANGLVQDLVHIRPWSLAKRKSG